MAHFDLHIPVLDEPSAEDLRSWANRHLEPGRPFRVDAWPLFLQALAGPLVCHPLTELQREALLGCLLYREGDTADLPEAQCRLILADLARELDTRVSFFDRGAFVRLNTRSPKDNFQWLDENDRLRPVTSGGQAIEVLLGSMERIFEDLLAAKQAQAEDPVCIVLRPFHAFEPWREFRLFIEHGKIAGMSQYFDHLTFPELAAHAPGFEGVLAAFAMSIADRAPWPSFTLDVWVEGAHRVRFLKVNPPVTWGVTAPALFRDDRLDGSFRWNASSPIG